MTQFHTVKKTGTAFMAAMLLAGGLLGATDAIADPGRGNGNGNRGWDQSRGDWRGNDRHYDRDDRRDDRRDDWRFRDNDRVVIHDYMVRNYTYTCKGKHCFKKGHQPRQQVRYVIGQPLPPGVYYREVPVSLRTRLQPVPVGYRYVQVDNDVLLMSEASKSIIDAVTLLSAVGNN